MPPANPTFTAKPFSRPDVTPGGAPNLKPRPDGYTRLSYAPKGEQPALTPQPLQSSAELAMERNPVGTYTLSEGTPMMQARNAQVPNFRYQPGNYYRNPMAPQLPSSGSQAIVPRASGVPAAPPEVPPAAGGRVVGLSPMGRTALGLGITAADYLTPRADDSTYGGAVVNGLRDQATRMGTGYSMGGVPGAIAGGIYDIGRQVYDAAPMLAEIPNVIQGYQESRAGNIAQQNRLQTAIQKHPENVTQNTYDQLATQQRQTARMGDGVMPTGVPATGNIVNAPVPMGAPAPVAVPNAVKTFAPTQDDIARFNHLSGGDRFRASRYNPHSAGDVASMKMMLGQIESPDYVKESNPAWDKVMNSQQANRYISEHRPGDIARNPMPAPAAPAVSQGAPAASPTSPTDNMTPNEQRIYWGNQMANPNIGGSAQPYKGSMIEGMPSSKYWAQHAAIESSATPTSSSSDAPAPAKNPTDNPYSLESYNAKKDKAMAGNYGSTPTSI